MCVEGRTGRLKDKSKVLESNVFSLEYKVKVNSDTIKTENTGRNTDDNKFSFECVESELLLTSYVVGNFRI